MRGRLSAIILCATAGFAISASAQELVYEPVNPSFGGDSFNSSHLLAIANAQNDYKDPNSKSDSNSQADQFIRQLQSRLLSSLAGEVNEAIFGDNPQDQGTITFGDQIIEFYRGLTSVHLTITDLSTGTTTEIEIPLLNVAPESGSTGSIVGSVLSSGETAGSTLSDDASDDPFGTTFSDTDGLSYDGGIY